MIMFTGTTRPVSLAASFALFTKLVKTTEMTNQFNKYMIVNNYYLKPHKVAPLFKFIILSHTKY